MKKRTKHKESAIATEAFKATARRVRLYPSFALSQSEPAAVQVHPTKTTSSSVAVSSSQLRRVAVLISRIPSRKAHGVSSKAGWSRRLVPPEPWRRRMPLVHSRGCSTGVIFPNRLGGLNCWLISDRFRPFLTDSDQKKEKINPKPAQMYEPKWKNRQSFPQLGHRPLFGPLDG